MTLRHLAFVARALARRATVCWLALAVILTARRARAHDPFQITATARVHADRIELRVTMFGRTAMQVCLDGQRPPSLDRAAFEMFRPQLEACAARLFDVTSGGERLVPRAATMVLTEENDVESALVYPPATAAPIVFDAVHLKRLSDPTYGAESRPRAMAYFSDKRSFARTSRRCRSTACRDCRRHRPTRSPPRCRRLARTCGSVSSIF